jgi:pimeloyl-ACP methyl ester carboxylesterase
LASKYENPYENQVVWTALVPSLVMASDKRPLVLLHPFLLSGNAWQDVVPLLSTRRSITRRGGNL